MGKNKKNKEKSLKKENKDENVETKEKNLKKDNKNTKENNPEKGKKEKKKTISINIDKGKLFKGLGCFLVVAVILGLSFLASDGYASKSVEFKNITIDEYLELMKEDEKHIVYVASPSCGYCNMETPILKRIAGKYDLEIHYLNTENFYDRTIQDYTEEGYKFINSSEVYSDGYGTPNTIIVQNGEIIDGVYQYAEAKELETLFKNNGFANE